MLLAEGYNFTNTTGKIESYKAVFTSASNLGYIVKVTSARDP